MQLKHIQRVNSEGIPNKNHQAHVQASNMGHRKHDRDKMKLLSF